MTSEYNLEEKKRIVRAFVETAFNQHHTDREADHLTAQGRDNSAANVALAAT